MQVLYKCRCMQTEVSVDVPTRQPGNDLMDWMNIVQQCIGIDHRGRSPRCLATEMEYAKIPYDETAEGIGMKGTVQ